MVVHPQRRIRVHADGYCGDRNTTIAAQLVNAPPIASM